MTDTATSPFSLFSIVIPARNEEDSVGATVGCCRPFISPHFKLTVELPLKAIVRGYSWTVISITWRNRLHWLAKLHLKEMGSRYLFVCLYAWLEKYFSRGDYRRSIPQ